MFAFFIVTNNECCKIDPMAKFHAHAKEFASSLFSIVLMMAHVPPPHAKQRVGSHDTIDVMHSFGSDALRCRLSGVFAL